MNFEDYYKKFEKMQEWIREDYPSVQGRKSYLVRRSLKHSPSDALAC